MKAILVIDMPKHCSECKLYMNNGNSYWCKATGIDTTGFTMPASCPLRPLPKRIPPNEYGNMTPYGSVWNACIDTILENNSGTNI